ncbi:MAG: VCBS repeat-containing protein [bacterium]|nr:VCBS repeat-containing protein [bacterium]
MKTTVQVLTAAALVINGLIPTQAHAGPITYTGIAPHGILNGLDCIIALPPTTEDAPDRFALGDAHGFVHVYEQRDQAYQEVWVSEYFESAIAGLFVADINLDDLQEIVVYTQNGRIHFLDGAGYRSLWSNPPTDYSSITVMALHNVDEDEQVELVFVADGRLHIYDGRDQFEEWRSDQDNITATEIVFGDVDGDGTEEIVLNDGFVFDARYRDLEWQSPEPFGERLGLLDVDDDTIPEIIGEFQGRFLRIFDVDLRRMKASRR